MRQIPRAAIPPLLALAALLAWPPADVAAQAGAQADAAADAAAQARAQSAEKLYYDPCPPYSADLDFDCYHTYAEATAFLRDAAARHPDVARLESIGRSYAGRDLWVLTVTDFRTGDPEDKPAVWVDGGIDADEVVAIEAALGLVHRLLESDDAGIAELRRTRAFYIAPVVIPDVSELHHTTPIRPRDTTLRPWDDDGDGLLDEDGTDDLDGDGEALRMRVEDPAGEWVKDERDGRAMRRRLPTDEGPFYALYPEGLDDDGDGEYGEDPVGGIDPNRNYPGNWSAGQGGAGPFPASEVELRAMLDFIRAHPNIAASQHLHSSGGVILRPPSVPDLELPASDYELYMDLAYEGMRITGYRLATSVYDWNWPRGSENAKRGQIRRTAEGGLRGWNEDVALGGSAFRSAVPIVRTRAAAAEAHGPGMSAYPAYGGSIDGMYTLFGALAFANEIYVMGEDTDGDGDIGTIEQLAYNDDALDGEAFREWTPFEHPELGPVEIGGWRKFGHNNPLPRDLPTEVRRNVDFVLMQARRTPRLALGEAGVEELGDGLYRVRAVVRNDGWQPTELAIRERRGTAVPVRVRIETGAGVELISSDARRELGTLGGHEAEEVEWIVRAPAGGEVTVTAAHPKAGRASRRVELEPSPTS